MGDWIYALVLFMKAHRRLPIRSLSINDVLYRIKTTSEISNPLRVFVSDKEYMKIFVGGVISHAHVVPTLAILKNAAEIDTFPFPERCCIKPTHASGIRTMRTAGETINREEIKRWLELNYYEQDREANYRPLQPKIIVEDLIFDVPDPIDYKLYCYRGKARLIQVHLERSTNHRTCFYDTGWNLQPYALKYPRHSTGIARPQNLEMMIALAEKLATYFEFIRVDLYSNGKEIYVGELTNCSGSANERFLPPFGEILASRSIFGDGDEDYH